MELPFKNISQSAHSIDAIKKFTAAHDRMPTLIVLCGPVGTGKTWDACGLARHVCRSKGFSQFVSCTVIQRYDSEEMDRLHRSKALILDDYGSRQSEGALMRAFELVDARMHNTKKATIITTNLIEDIRKIDERMASRLNTACIIDYRGMPDRRIHEYA